MLEDYYVKPATVDRVRASWLAPQIESYLEWLESHRYSHLAQPNWHHFFRPVVSGSSCGLHCAVQAEGRSPHTPRFLLSFASFVAILLPRGDHDSRPQRSCGNAADISTQ